MTSERKTRNPYKGRKQHRQASESNSSSDASNIHSTLSPSIMVDEEPVVTINSAKQLNISDFECPLCLSLLYEPVGFHCGHVFCKFCIERWMSSNGQLSQCPCCRTSLGATIALNHIGQLITLRTVLQTLFESQYKQRGVEVERERAEFRSTRVIRKRFFIGNEHELVQDRSDQNVHKWTMFVRMDGDIEQYIESVEFKLHPTFRPPNIILTAAPFQLTRYGWGYFTITVKLNFKQYLNKPPFLLNHTLSFDGNGSMGEVDIDFVVRSDKLLEDDMVEN